MFIPTLPLTEQIKYRLTSLLPLLFLLMSSSLTQWSCASQQASEPLEQSLFERADQDATRIDKEIQQRGKVTGKVSTKKPEDAEALNRAETIRKYQSLLKNKDRLDPATHEACLLNLGHTTFEQCLADYRKDMKAFNKAYEERRADEKRPEPGLPRYDFSPAREVYETFLETFPNSQQQAEVLYNMAYSYEEEGDLDRAVTLYDDLALVSPDTRYGPEVFMRLGEHHFEANEFDKAKEYYEQVVNLGDTPFYAKALFKIGWCHYAKDQRREAKKAFAHVLDLQATGKGREQGELYDESLDILAKILSETGGAKALQEFLKTYRDPPYGLDLSLQLARHFQETSRYDDAIKAYRNLLKTFPFSPQAPFVEQSLIECLETEAKTAEAMALRATLLDRYGRGTPWDQHNRDHELRQEVDTLLMDTMSKEILAHHRKARKNKDPQQYQVTIALYQKALAYFPEDEQTYETRYHFADCLLESGRLKEAAKEYDRVSKMEPYQQYREKAATKRIQCLERLREEDRTDMNTLLSAYWDYVGMFPQSEKTPPLLFKQGEMLFNAGRYDEAGKFFQEIIENHPQYSEVLRAWLLKLEALFQSTRYYETEQFAENLLSQPYALSDEQQKRVNHLLRIAQFEQAHADQEAGKYVEAAWRYEQLVNEAPWIEIGPDALFNAAVCYKKAEDWPRAAACFDRITTLFPQSKYYSDALLAPLAYYEQTEQWEQILVVLDKLYQKDPKNELAQETLYKIAKRFYREGRIERTQELFTEYIRRYPGDMDRKLEIAYLEARISEEQGGHQAAMNGYDRFLRAYNKASAVQPSVKVDPLYLARARFLVLDPVYESYTAIQLREPLQQNLKKKQSLLESLVSGYMKIAKSGTSEYALAAGYRIAEAYEDFWRSLLDSEIPQGMTAEEILAYRELLIQQATPYLDKAEGAYKVTLKRAGEKRVFNPWVMKAYCHLSSLEPNSFPPLFQDSVVWQESWREKRSLIRRIDQNRAQPFSEDKAASLQSVLDKALDTVNQALKEKGVTNRDQILRAIDILQRLLEKEPSLFEAHFNSGVLYQMIGRPEKAKEEYRAALRQNKLIPVAHLNLGIIYLQEGILEKAENHFREMTVLSPRYAGAWYLLGVSMNKRGAFPEAQKPLEHATVLLPQFLDPYVEWGWALINSGQEQEARERFLTVSNHAKANIRVLRKLGWCLLAADLSDEAIAVYNQILRMDGSGYEDLNNLGTAYLRKGETGPARENLLKAVEKNPNRPEAINNLGLVYVREKQYNEAVVSFQQASGVQPSSLPPLLNVAVVYGAFQEDMEKANRFISKYLTQGGRHQKEMLEDWNTRTGEGENAQAD